MNNPENIDYSGIDKIIELIKKEVCSYITNIPSKIVYQEIDKAYQYAKDAHHGDIRLSGEPYIAHPVQATLILLNIKPDIYTIQSCLLHDVIEDTPRTYDDILEHFGPQVARISAGMEKLSKVRYIGEERAIGSLRKMFVAMSEDLRVIFVKLADRLHNMRTLKYHPRKDKRERIALETLNIYAPIADRLGLHWFKNQLDEECFKILNPSEYKRIKNELDKQKDVQIAFENNAKEVITQLLRENIEHFKIEFRVKSIYSIFKKMQRKNLESVMDLHDIYGIKIIVDDVTECYKALGLIHTITTPIPKHFKDYIALPKPNGYKSLHTTVLGLLRYHRTKPTEIQIKTFEMDKTSQIGIAAHFEYKEKGSVIAHDIDWVKQLKDITKNLGNEEFMDSLKVDLFKDRIFTLTPRGDTINLPAGSTPIDFAYEIHTELGNHIFLAKVNGQVYPLDKELRNGDIVEIFTDKNKKPNPLNLGVVRTTKAKNCIRSYMRNEDKTNYIERGREILNNQLEKAGFKKLDKDMSLLKSFDDRVYTVEERYEILEQIGNLSINPTSIVKKLSRKEHLPHRAGIKPPVVMREEPKKESLEILIGNQKGIPYRVGTCCEGKLTRSIVAYVNGKGVITIHNRSCSTLNRLDKERLLSAYYEGEETNKTTYTINLLVRNKHGVFKKIIDVLFEMHIDINNVNTKIDTPEKAHIFIELIILDHDYMVIDRITNRISIILGELLMTYSVKHGRYE